MTEEQNVKNLEEQQAQAAVVLPHEYLIEGVKQGIEQIKREMAAAQKKYGERYNRKNIYEEFGRRFGYDDPEKIWQEFCLVFEKRSNQPSQIRKVIERIGDMARFVAGQRYMAEQQKEK